MPAIYLHQTNANPTLMLLTYSNPRVYSLLCITPLHVNTLKTFWKWHKSCPYVSVMECVWNFTSPQMLVFHLGHFPPLQDFSLRGRGKCRQFSSAVGWPERLTQVTLRRLKPFPQEAGHYDEKEREREREGKPCREAISHVYRVTCQNCALGWNYVKSRNKMRLWFGRAVLVIREIVTYYYVSDDSSVDDVKCEASLL